MGVATRATRATRTQQHVSKSRYQHQIQQQLQHSSQRDQQTTWQNLMASALALEDDAVQTLPAGLRTSFASRVGFYMWLLQVSHCSSKMPLPAVTPVSGTCLPDDLPCTACPA